MGFEIPTRLKHPSVALAILEVLKNSNKMLKSREISGKVNERIGDKTTASSSRVAKYCECLPQVRSEKDGHYNIYGFDDGG